MRADMISHEAADPLSQGSSSREMGNGLRQLKEHVGIDFPELRIPQANRILAIGTRHNMKVSIRARELTLVAQSQRLLRRTSKSAQEHNAASDPTPNGFFLMLGRLQTTVELTLDSRENPCNNLLFKHNSILSLRWNTQVETDDKTVCETDCTGYFIELLSLLYATQTWPMANTSESAERCTVVAADRLHCSQQEFRPCLYSKVGNSLDWLSVTKKRPVYTGVT